MKARWTLIWFCCVIVPVLLAGCEKSVGVGGGYVVSAPASWDGEHHSNALYFQGKKICDGIGLMEYHDGALVFIGLGNDQLYAVRGATPMVMLSNRIVDRVETLEPLLPGGQHETVYTAEDLKSTPTGVKVKYYVGTSEKTGDHQYETHDLTWKQINDWIDEAERTEAVVQSSTGDYRVLHRLKNQP